MNKPIIGGEFSFNPDLLLKKDSVNSIFAFLENSYKNLSLFSSGRDAIYALALNLKPKNVFLPDYLCESVYQPFATIPTNIQYYPIKMDLTADIEYIDTLQLDETTIFFVVNYFGMIDLPLLNCLNRKRKKSNNLKVVIDVTHSMFDDQATKLLSISDYLVGSLRKWFFLPDGGFLSGEKKILPLSNHSSVDFWSIRTGACLTRYLAENYLSTDDDYHALIKAEEILKTKKNLGNKICDLSILLLKKYDKDGISNIRKENFKTISKVINKKQNNQFRLLLCSERSFFIPILFKEKKTRDYFRNFLIEKGVLCPIHWDTAWNKEIHPLSDIIASIPCDQRMKTYEINVLLDSINSYLIV